MSVLELPPQLRGPWEHALLMTYGLDIAFFERTLLPLFASTCRNKIVLLNGAHFQEICAGLTKNDGRFLHFNQSYLAAGIFAPYAAHTKLILLANKKQGRLLVGSGNISWQGYASGGELFTAYEYTQEQPESLPAFLTARELVDKLVSLHYIHGLAREHIQYFWDSVPWLLPRLYHNSPVKHNLTTNFLEQIKQTIGEDVVEELWVCAPFFDERVTALETVVKTVRPIRTILLLQSGYASVDQFALQQVIDRLPGNCEIRPILAQSEPLYLHAKFYLFKLTNRALCVQGSPNMSQVAMLFHVPQGNVEMANFLTGPRGAFDSLLTELPLTLGASQADLSGIELAYQKKDRVEASKESGWELLGGEWQNDRLLLYVRHQIPDLQDVHLVICGRSIPLTEWNVKEQSLELTLSEHARELLTNPTPVSLQWNDGTQICETNAIIPCDKNALKRMLQLEEQGGEQLANSADLNLNDQTFEVLLGELLETLAIDQESIWKSTPPSPKAQKEIPHGEGRHIGYDEIDYEALRTHPKIRQYLERGSDASTNRPTRIEIIMRSITKHMHGLFSQEEAMDLAIASAIIPSSEESEDELFVKEEPEKEENHVTRHWSTQARIRKTLSRFIQRYLGGLSSPEFQQLVGYEVVTKNYLIFSHLLWRLFAKDWLEYSTIVEGLIRSWQLFWGNQASPGYFSQLSIDEQLEIWQWMRDYRNDALLLAGYYYSATMVMKEQQEDLRFKLRESWRSILSIAPFPLTAEVVEDTHKLLASLLPYRPPKLAEIVNELIRLASFETQRNVIAQLVIAGFLPVGSASFKKEKIGDKASAVDCLVITSEEVLSTKEAALSLLQAWMQIEQRGYYRMITKGSNADQGYTNLIFYDTESQNGRYARRDEQKKIRAQEISHLQISIAPWENELKHVRELVEHLSND